MANQRFEVKPANKVAVDGEFESFATSMPIVCGFYWYWSPHDKDFVIAEAVLHKEKIKLKINGVLQAFIDEGGFIHSQITKPCHPKVAP